MDGGKWALYGERLGKREESPDTRETDPQATRFHVRPIGTGSWRWPGHAGVGYLAAFFTGLRRGELKALQWGDVHLEVEQPFIAVRASTTKNPAPASIRLHPQLVGELRSMRPAEASAADPVLSRENQASMWMMRNGLGAAGIPFADAQGRRADFHSLRGARKMPSVPRLTFYTCDKRRAL